MFVNAMTRRPPFDIRFQTPACFLLLGPSGSGKTHWLLSLLRNHATYFKKPLGVVYYFYMEDDKTHDQFQAIPGLKVHMMRGAHVRLPARSFRPMRVLKWREDA